MSKLIKDPVHGLIELNDLQSELLEQPEIQRLGWIRQLGLVKVVYPGANHTRLEHVIGTSHVAGVMADSLKLAEAEKSSLQAAGMLHDVGHTPFSHTLEPLLPKDHMEHAQKAICDGENIPPILERHGLQPREILKLICGRSRSYLNPIINSDLDADQLDYLSRDSHYTGVSYGVIDAERLIRMMRLSNGKICLLEKGIDAAEEFLVARDHMFSSVYLHHTSRIAEMMLLRAMGSAVAELPDFATYTDGQLLERLREANAYGEDIVGRLMRRDLFKRAYSLSRLSATKRQVAALRKLGERKAEQLLCAKAGVEEGYVIADMPAEALKVSEPRLKRVSIPILLQNGSIADLYDLSSLARALTKRESSESLFSVYCLDKHRQKVGRAAEALIG